MSTQQSWRERLKKQYPFGIYSPELNRIDDDVESFIASELEAQKARILKVVEDWSNTCGDGCEGELINKIKEL